MIVFLDWGVDLYSFIEVPHQISFFSIRIHIQRSKRIIRKLLVVSINEIPWCFCQVWYIQFVLSRISVTMLVFSFPLCFIHRISTSHTLHFMQDPREHIL